MTGPKTGLRGHESSIAERSSLLKKSVLSVVVLLAILAGNASATYMLTRGASVLKPLQFVGYVAAGFSRTTQRYDTVAEKYVTLPSSGQTSTISTDVLLGVSLLKNLELVGVAPIVSKTQGDQSAFGLGDAALMLRYGLLGAPLPFGLTLAASVNMPTSAKDAVLKLGDRSTDIALGATFQTVSVGPLAIHARAAYWLNGKADATRYGNMFEYVVFPDFVISPKASIFPMLAGAMATDNVINGVKLAASGASVHSAGLGMTWNPVGSFWLKPKATVPLTLLSSGGSLPRFAFGLDLWAVLP